MRKYFKTDEDYELFQKHLEQALDHLTAFESQPITVSPHVFPSIALKVNRTGYWLRIDKMAEVTLDYFMS